MAKKSNKKEVRKESPKTGNINSLISIGKIIFLLSAFTAGLASYYVYVLLFTIPELPKMDPNQWWGPYPMDPKQDVSIRPFKVEFSDVMVNDLRERLLHRRPFTPPLENAGFTYGFNSHFLTRVLDYWQNKYNFKEREEFFNIYQHYKTNVQGLNIHFVHVKPKVAEGIEVIPLLMLHGWPGSIREFYEVIPKLTTPRPKHKFVFEIIAPSLPGFGFSEAPVRPGMGLPEMAVVLKNLMTRLGIERYYIHGGDVGHAVGADMATLFPDNVLGFHTNTPILFMNPLAPIITWLGSFWPSLIVEPEVESWLYPLNTKAMFILEETGYMHIQATKPDTIGTALTDSPAGLAAYILEKFSTWTNPSYRKANDGNLLAKYSLTNLLDNVMVYWVNNCITTSVRTYAATLSKRQFELKMEQIPTSVPTWGLKFKHDLMFQPDVVLKLKYKNYLHSTMVEDGGHFAAMENPDILASDVFEAIDMFVEFHGAEGKPNTAKSRTDFETSQPETNFETAKTIYEFTAKDINGREVKLDKYKGHVTLIVNVASQCGLTDRNYKQLNELYDKYAVDKGLRILAFPCNQFNSQEPGNSEEIFKFTKDKGVKFDLFEKIEVNGENAHPLWKFLKRTQPGTLGDFIKWNFSKFIVNKDGVPVERLGPNVDPLDLEPYLAKYW